MSQAKAAIEHLSKEWLAERQLDNNLDNAWKNCTQMLYQGTIESLEACGELILRMDWISGLSAWVQCSEDNVLQMASHIQPEERSLFAYVLMFCQHRCLNGTEHSWVRMWSEDLDWSRVSVAAGSVPLLEDIPEWLIESLIMGLMDEVTIIPKEYATQERLGVENPFTICRYPVTQVLVETLIGEHQSEGLGPLYPIDSISWLEAIQLCNQLSAAFGLPTAYDMSTPTEPKRIASSEGFRLPTVKEWTLAASLRGSPVWKYAGAAELWTVGVYDSSGSEQVGRNKPNRLGLFDMSGNVWEWCWDHDEIYAHRKGGSWMSKEEACAITFESRRLKNCVLPTQGFRLCRSVFTEVDATPVESAEKERKNEREEEWDNWEW